MNKVLFFCALLLSFSAHAEDLFDTILLLAHQGKKAELRSLQQHGYNLNMLNDRRQTPLMVLYKYNDATGIKTLADLGVYNSYYTRPSYVPVSNYAPVVNYASTSNYTLVTRPSYQNTQPTFQNIERPKPLPFYISGRAGIGLLKPSLEVSDDLRSKDFSFKETAGVFTLAYGYQLTPLRFEVEGGVNLFGKDQIEENELELKTHSFSGLLNAYWDIPTNTSFYPYIGAGLGISYNQAELEKYKNHAWDFAWQIGAGLNYDINDRTTLDLGYRYMNYGSIKLVKENGVDYDVNDLKAHIVSLGIRYKL